jgi:hypothetical protein
MKKARTVLAAAALIVLTALVAVAVTATTGIAGTPSKPDQLTGTWNVLLERPAPLPPLKSVQVFTSSGGVIEMANESPAGRTAQYGAWERTRGRLYAASGIIYQFDPKGNFVATAKINRTIELGPDGNTFKHIARVSIYDTKDHLVTSFVARASGVRMPVERISDVP